MQIAQLSHLKSWFIDYTRSFLTGVAPQNGPLMLKIDHTTRVCGNMLLLAHAMDLPDDRRRVAEAIGLLHDLGRFEQYQRFQTFNDRKSVNHAALGIDVLARARALQHLDMRDRILIDDAVRFHNAPVLPSNKPPASMLFMRMIRDADKLDIWKIFADCYRDNRLPDPAIVQGLPDLPVWTADIIAAIDQRRTAKFQDLRTLNDFKLLKLSWVFDLNFEETFVQARKRGDLTAIADSLPDAPAVRRSVAAVMHRLDEMANVNQN